MPTCRLSDPLGGVRDRMDAAGSEICVVVNDGRIVLGLLRGDAFDGEPARTAEEAMHAGPPTVRPNEPLDALATRMREKSVTGILVTTSDGRLVGALQRDDAERRLAGQKP